MMNRLLATAQGPIINHASRGVSDVDGFTNKTQAAG